jgi:putative transposase
LSAAVKRFVAHGRCWTITHTHLLLRTGNIPITTVMRRLLNGYAVSFNRRHRRQGRLFQNRYKSILCQEDPYLMELVRYIHLNPLRAGIVKDLDGLDGYAYCGHSRLTGRIAGDWQAEKGCSSALSAFYPGWYRLFISYRKQKAQPAV